MAGLTPDDIEGRVFRTGFRGYDQLEVREFLTRISRFVRELADERDRLLAELGPLAGRDLAAELDAVAAEVGEVLQAARTAAEAIRAQAVADAARWRQEASAAAEEERRRLAAEAEEVRAAAEAEGQAALADAARHREEAVAAAEQEALKLVGDAEREAHRRAVAARKESEDLLRTARTEADRLLADAQVRHDDIIASAQRLVEATQERARALEARRDELRREVEEMRRLLGGPEEPPLPEEEPEPAPEPSERPAAGGPPAGESPWEPGGTVRVVRPGAEARRSPDSRGVPVEPGEEPDVRVISPEELARRLESGTLVSGDSVESGPGVETVGAVDAVEPVADEADTAAPERGDVTPAGEETAPETPVVPGPEAAPPADAGGASSPDELPVPDLSNLFARLRAPAPPPGEPAGSGAGEPVSAEPAAEEVAAKEPAAGEPAADEPAAAEPAGGGPAAAVPAPPAGPRVREDVDPFELRDRLLLPVTNRALRNLKRQLTEEQNAALEEVRLDEGGWQPDAAALAAALRADLVVLMSESYAAGHAGAEELLGTRVRRAPTPPFEVADLLADALAEDVALVLREGRTLGHGARQLASGVSRVFRGWRTDEAERRVRDWALGAYHAGFAAALRQEGAGDLRWVVAGRGCASCRAAAEAPVAEPPPGHGGCACTILPAATA